MFFAPVCAIIVSKFNFYWRKDIETVIKKQTTSRAIAFIISSLALITAFIPQSKIFMQEYINTNSYSFGITSDLTIFLIIISMVIAINPFIIHNKTRHLQSVMVMSVIAAVCNYMKPIAFFVSTNKLEVLIVIVLITAFKLFNVASDTLFGYSDDRDTGGYLLESVLDVMDVFGD